MLAANRPAIDSGVHPSPARLPDSEGEDAVVLAAQLALPEPLGEHVSGPNPGGPCPDCREFVAANIWLLAFSF
jgi:hypothetical protein